MAVIDANLGVWTALSGLAAVDVATFLSDPVRVGEPLCREAYAWARRVNQRRAYDGFYLALAERLGAVLWTADRRLFNAARVLRLD